MGSLTIAKDGIVLYTRAIGYSQINETEKRPLTAANRYRIGSITKMFTATMTLQLVDEGKGKSCQRPSSATATGNAPAGWPWRPFEG
jgi:hypothetical protein